MVGNRDLLICKGVIDLPDVVGRPDYDQQYFRVYEKIIGTIEREVKMLDSTDIIVKRRNDGCRSGPAGIPGGGRA